MIIQTHWKHAFFTGKRVNTSQPIQSLSHLSTYIYSSAFIKSLFRLEPHFFWQRVTTAQWTHPFFGVLLQHHGDVLVTSRRQWKRTWKAIGPWWQRPGMARHGPAWPGCRCHGHARKVDVWDINGNYILVYSNIHLYICNHKEIWMKLKSGEWYDFRIF